MAAAQSNSLHCVHSKYSCTPYEMSRRERYSFFDNAVC